MAAAHAVGSVFLSAAVVVQATLVGLEPILVLQDSLANLGLLCRLGHLYLRLRCREWSYGPVLVQLGRPGLRSMSSDWHGVSVGLLEVQELPSVPFRRRQNLGFAAGLPKRKLVH